MIIDNIDQIPKAEDHPGTRVIVSGGGTGGHIYPALAIANALKKHDPSMTIIFVGAKGRMEMDKVPAAGYDILGLPVRGFDRKNPLRNISVMLDLFKSMKTCRKVIDRFQPHLAIGVGGYASGALLKVAQKKGIPTLIDEQNSYAGVTNKLLAKKAKKICVAYEGMERYFPADKIVMTGNPIREEIAEIDLTPEQAKEKLGFPADRPLVLTVGGSLGARTINESINLALEAITSSGASLLWQTGKYWTPTDASSRYTSVKEVTFIDRMDLAYRAADLVVSRAGASTISELQLLGKPAIIVPSPNVAEDHQRKNAEALADRSAAIMILDRDARLELGAEIVALLQSPERRKVLSKNVAAMALRCSAEKIVEQAMNLINDGKKF